MTAEEALLRLAEATADAVAEVLRTLAGDSVDRGAAAVVPEGQSAFQEIWTPSVVATADYASGGAGGNAFVLSRAGAHRLAAALTGSVLEPGREGQEVDELELLAVGEAASRMMAAAAAAASRVLGQEVELSRPRTRAILGAEEAERDHERTRHATVVPFAVLQEPCLLVQHVPDAVAARMTRTCADVAAGIAADGLDREGRQPPFSPELLRSVPVRVSVELGRARMPLARAVGLPAGAVVELDRAADDPVDLLVNGRRYAEGRLVLLDGREWALRIERVLGAS